MAANEGKIFTLRLPQEAVVFVDGRYTLQVRDQVDTSLFEPRHITEQPPADWLAEQLKPGQKVGYDPWLLPQASVDEVGSSGEASDGARIMSARIWLRPVARWARRCLDAIVRRIGGAA